MISRESTVIREKSHGGALPVWSGSDAMPVWRDMCCSAAGDAES
jgi:hypothetical protein